METQAIIKAIKSRDTFTQSQLDELMDIAGALVDKLGPDNLTHVAYQGFVDCLKKQCEQFGTSDLESSIIQRTKNVLETLAPWK